MAKKALIIINYILAAAWVCIGVKYLMEDDASGVGVMAMGYIDLFIAEWLKREE